MAQGRLTPDGTLRVLRRSTRVLRWGDGPSVALQSVGDLLVPSVADHATVYARDNDGRLHALGESGLALHALARTGEGPSAEERGGSLGPDDDHPAAVACRRGVTTVVGRGDEAVRTAGPGEEVPEAIAQVALPLVRDGECVGALHVSVDPGATPYGPSDLPGLLTLCERISLFLENLRLRREVDAARRVKADFLSVMSHELRTPLTAVVGYADLLSAGIAGPVNEGQIRQLERIKGSAWELQELIEGILGYARYEGEQPDLLVSLVQPRELVEEAVAVARPRVLEKGVSLTVDAPEDLPVLRTDRDKAVRILYHLVNNAEKFTDQGEIAVRVEADRDWIRFEVADTGPGIEASEVGQIFEPFWQGERAETRTRGGTGLGLSMARRFAELLSGEIDVDSRVGRGSTFTLRLPRTGPHPTFP